MNNWNRHTQKLAESPQWFPDLWSERYYDRREKWKPLELPVPRKTVNQSNYWFLERLQRLCHHQGLKGWRGGNSHHITFQLTYVAHAEDWWVLQMAVEYHKLNQVVTPVAAAVTDVASLLEQINIPRCLVYSYWSGKCFLLHSYPWSTRSSLPSAINSSNIPSLTYLRGISTL